MKALTERLEWVHHYLKQMAPSDHPRNQVDDENMRNFAIDELLACKAIAEILPDQVPMPVIPIGATGVPGGTSSKRGFLEAGMVQSRYRQVVSPEARAPVTRMIIDLPDR